MKRSLLGALATAVTAVAAWWVWPAAGPEALPPSSAAPSSLPPASLAETPQAHASAASAVAQAHAWLQQEATLRGSQMDGGWRLNVQGGLEPDMAVRRRFDYFLQLLGQQPIERIGAQLRSVAEQELPPAATQEVMQLWTRYVALQQVRYSSPVDPANPSSLQAALTERQVARRSALGRVWADAFYAEEEAQLLQLAHAPAARTVTLIDRDALDPAAQARLAQEEARQARWAAKLAQARAEAHALAQAPELSPLQRQQAQQALLQRFSAAEQVRVAALLGLPPP